MLFLWAFSITVFISQWQTTLLPGFVGVLLMFGVIGLPFIFSSRIVALIVGVFIGLGWSNFYAQQLISHRLDASLFNEDVNIVVQINSLPKPAAYATQFTAVVESAEHVLLQPLLQQALSLKHYKKLSAAVEPCQRWAFTVRLKPVRGLANIAGFDYQAYMFQQGIQLRGYVREAKRLPDASGFCLNKLRFHWQKILLTAFSRDDAAWLAAISIGDKSLFSPSQRSLLQDLGIFHLFVISGLHIALVAGAVYSAILLLRFMGGGLLFMGDWRPAARLLAFSAALFYGLMAGWQLPVQRAIITLAIFMLGAQCGLRWSLWLRFSWALFLVLLLQPLSPLNPGFVLSFSAVFLLIMARSYPFVWVNKSTLPLWLQKLHVMFSAQWVIAIGLMPILLLYFQQWSWLMMLANLVLIPLMAFAVVPPVLLAMLLWLITADEQLPVVILQGINFLLNGIQPVLEQSLLLLSASYPWPAWSPVSFIICMLGVLLLLGPRILASRLIGALLLFLVLQPKTPLWDDDVLLKMQVLDVGQGLSILLQTAQHSALYDTGAGWTNGSMAQRVHKPVFHRLGLQRLDKLIISHKDNDHSGGAADILSMVDVASIEGAATVMQKVMPCMASQQWVWDEVTFSYLHPQKNVSMKKTNNRSCVLFIDTGLHKILLSGDIEKKVEKLLLALEKVPEVDILLVPHHGSKTSSTAAFIEKSAPQLAIVSAGFLNRFHHPHPKVSARYEKAGIALLNTADSGAISIMFYKNGQMKIHKARDQSRYFW